MIVGLDARPALYSRTGFGRVCACLLDALGRRPGLTVKGYGVAWRRPRPDAPNTGIVRRRWPSRGVAALAPFGFGVETVLGPIDLFHHTDLVFAPVRRVPEVLTIYDLVYLQDERWHEPGFRRRVEPRVRARAAAAAAIVVPARRVADDVLAAGLARADQIHVVPLGADHVDRPSRSPDLAPLLRKAGLAPADDDLLVLVPGTREPRKNQTALLDAFLSLENPRARLLFVGPAGWCVQDLERRLAPDARPERVGVAGEVDDDELIALLHRADLVAYPSLAEGFGLPVAEAMRCGRAVLTSVNTPMADYGGDAVLTVDPTDVRSIAAGLSALLDDEDRRRELGGAARAAASLLTWDRAAASLESIYREVAPA